MNASPDRRRPAPRGVPGPTRTRDPGETRGPARRGARGFTLVELVVCLALLGLMGMLAMPMVEVTRQREREVELRRALREIRGALDRYKEASDAGNVARAPGASGWPPTLEALVDGVPDQRDPKKRPLYFLRGLPRDPFAADPSVPAAATWQLRSSESPPDNPQPGPDVFDVRSRSDAVALDGRPVKEW